MEPPPRPSWKFRERDIRIDWSILTLIDEEGPSCRNLFGGQELLPFAALYRGELHPDAVGLTDGDCDLVCFFYESKKQRPHIVIWRANQAHEEHWRWVETHQDRRGEGRIARGPPKPCKPNAQHCNVAGTLYAIDNTCSREGGPLGEGTTNSQGTPTSVCVFVVQCRAAFKHKNKE